MSQTTPTIRRTQKQRNRLGRTRVLTDTPELNAIEQDRVKQLEKIEKTRRRLQPALESTKTSKRRKLTNTPEKNASEQDQPNKQEKVAKTRRRLQPVGNTMAVKRKTAENENDAAKINFKKRTSARNNDKENDLSASPKQIERPSNVVPVKTRTGRVVKPANKKDMLTR